MINQLLIVKTCKIGQSKGFIIKKKDYQLEENRYYRIKIMEEL